ncbi:MAG: hypothetical protein QM770_18505 [Tepidisphaeraceae bacterium]
MRLRTCRPKCQPGAFAGIGQLPEIDTGVQVAFELSQFQARSVHTTKPVLRLAGRIHVQTQRLHLIDRRPTEQRSQADSRGRAESYASANPHAASIRLAASPRQM